MHIFECVVKKKYLTQQSIIFFLSKQKQKHPVHTEEDCKTGFLSVNSYDSIGLNFRKFPLTFLVSGFSFFSI